jgi:ATP-dependent Clp protease ATP-binding subunit ClpA
VDEPAIRLLAEQGFDPVYGARGLRRALRANLAAPVAAEVLRVRPAGTDPVRIAATATDGTIVAAAS